MERGRAVPLLWSGLLHSYKSFRVGALAATAVEVTLNRHSFHGREGDNGEAPLFFLHTAQFAGLHGVHIVAPTLAFGIDCSPVSSQLNTGFQNNWTLVK